jgi:hypothetical protein
MKTLIITDVDSISKQLTEEYQALQEELVRTRELLDQSRENTLLLELVELKIKQEIDALEKKATSELKQKGLAT